MRRTLAVTTLLLVLASPARAAAPEDVANEVSQNLMSPFCPGVTVHDCTSQEALEMRTQILEWAQAGWSRDRIEDELVAEYGKGMLPAPRAEGAGLIVWLAPALALLAGGWAAYLVARRWRARSAPDRGAPAPAPADARRVDEELDKMRSAW